MCVLRCSFFSPLVPPARAFPFFPDEVSCAIQLQRGGQSFGARGCYIQQSVETSITRRAACAYGFILRARARNFISFRELGGPEISRLQSERESSVCARP